MRHTTEMTQQKENRTKSHKFETRKQSCSRRSWVELEFDAEQKY